MISLFFLPLFSPVLSLTAICFGELRLNLPVRYLHIQLVDNGNNVTESRGSIEYSLNIDSSSYAADVIDKGDGSYIFRLILRRTVDQLLVSLFIEGEYLCNSPFLVKRNENQLLNPELCDCPLEINKWIQLANCSMEPQVEQDLQPFPSIDFQSVLKQAVYNWGMPEHSKAYAFCHYQIIDNRIYRKCYGEYVDFRFFLDETLTSFLRKISLPNTEFIFNLGDYPISRFQDNLPIVSWCGSTSTLDIVIPTYIYARQVTGYTLSDLNMHYSGPSIPWKNKINKAIFRGRDSNLLRLALANITAAEPDGLIDAGITTYFFYPADENSPRRERIPFKDFFKYKYILSVDGTVAAYRLPSLLSGSSIVFKSDSPYYEHFYSKMEPYVHYIPFNRDNVQTKLEWAMKNDLNETLTKKRQFVLDHLQPKNMYCYLAQFFKSYSKRLTKRPQNVQAGLEAAEGVYLDCQCYKESNKTEL